MTIRTDADQSAKSDIANPLIHMLEMNQVRLSLFLYVTMYCGWEMIEPAGRVPNGCRGFIAGILSLLYRESLI